MSAYTDSLALAHEASDPALVAALAVEGFRFATVLVVRFLDTNESARAGSTASTRNLGTSSRPSTETRRATRPDLHAYAVEHFGADCALIY